MQTISYLLLDAFVVFLAIALFWAAFMKGASLFTYLVKLGKQIKFKRQANTNSCATPIKEKEPREMWAETKILTPFPELRDWSKYDSPAHLRLRKGVLIH